MNWTEFRKAIVAHFNTEEIRTLCYDMNVDYDSLGGEGKEGKVRELIIMCRRHGREEQLLSTLKLARPNIEWPDLVGIVGPIEVDQVGTGGEDKEVEAFRPKGHSYNVQIGNVGSGAQIAVGENISQQQIVSPHEFDELFDELRKAIKVAPGEAEQRLALKKVIELKAETESTEPNLDRLERLKVFFLKSGGLAAEAVEKLFRSEPMQKILARAAEGGQR